MTLLAIALRSHAGGFLAVSLIGAMFGVANAAAFSEIAGPTAAERAVFARQMEVVGRQLSYLLPNPMELDTLAGFLQWRMFGMLPVVFGFWAVLAASGAGRGDEERGFVEAWTAAGVTRLRYVATRVVAFVVLANVALAVTVALTYGASVVAGEALPLRGLLLQWVALAALTAACFGLSLVVAQLATTRRSAGGIAGVGLLALFLVNSATRSGGLEGIAWTSPFWLYERSAPLLASGTFDAPSAISLAALAIALFSLAAAGFARRDLGGSLFRAPPRGGRSAYRPSPDPLLRLPVLAAVAQQRWWVAGWMIGLAGLATFMTSLVRTMVDAMLAIPTLRAYFERLGPTTGYDTFVAVIWGSTALLLLALFAVFQVNGWVADDAEGRLEAALAQPASRARLALERIASLGLGAGLVAAAGAAAVWVVAARSGIALSAGRFAAGSALMLTVPLAFGAIGAVLAGWRPRAAVPVLTLVAIVSYFIVQFAPLFGWPRWVERISIFSLYGEPIARGVEWPGILTLLAIAAVGTAAGTILFQRRDVGR